MRHHHFPTLAVTLSALASGTAWASDDDAVKVGGVIFSHLGADLSEGAEGASEFGVDRVYLNFKAKVSDALSTRVYRVFIDHDGDDAKPRDVLPHDRAPHVGAVRMFGNGSADPIPFGAWPQDRPYSQAGWTSAAISTTPRGS